MIRQDIENKLKIFFETKTPTFLKVKSEKSFKVMNGFITNLNGEYIYFKDVKIGIVPILKSDILFVDVSRYKELQKGADNGE